ncbi:site-specific recombination directionality factor RDF [Mycobacterium phage EagleEye]|uniref:RDF protein n=1 Tax=Mycobacterium phage EagleEye TaxID=1429759 RepID=W0LIY3_9CAUD|nr:site-specific recombination directionality factor RDF [Mycobacterium phage EagleEye]AHG23863.1 hypothetical protein PBI_EAGLEEYE_83 [Mycobacterium phage EagleEye]
MRAFAGWALTVGMVVVGLGFPGPAAAAVTCEHRSEAHQIEHGGHAADSAWHISRGERPTCDPDDGARQDDHRDRDKKSRYCRKRWFC